MRWDFIIRVLFAFMFSPQFCTRIHSIFHSTRISILINYTPKDYFTCTKGVRQGDPLSPFLFGIAKDFLQCYLNAIVSWNDLTPISSPKGSVSPTPLLYADDILLFCKGIANNIKNVATALNFYGNLSGQHFSWDKSFIYFGAVIPHHRQNTLLELAGISRGSLPFTYFGVPLFNDFLKALHL